MTPLPPSRLLLVAQGTLGDVLPLLAIGEGLRAAGHAVRVLAPDAMRAETERRGLVFRSIGGNDPRRVHTELVTQAPRGYWRNAAARVRRLVQAPMLPTFESVLALQDEVAWCQGAVVSFLVPYVTFLAERLGRPAVLFHPTPTLPAGAYAHPVGPLAWHLLPKPALLNRATHAAWGALVHRATGAWTDALRREHLGLAPRRDPWADVPRLVAASPALLPPPRDWPPHWELTGSARPAQPPAPVPAALERFLADGPPPLFVGFSSSPVDREGFWEDVVLRAARRLGLRVVLGAGWSTLPPGLDRPGEVLSVGSVPYASVFPRMAAVLHACGVGTLSEAVLAGVPSVTAPAFGEQKLLAARAWRAGLVPRPVALQELTAERLEHALREALADGPLRARTREVGARMQAERGVERAVAFVERHLGGGAATARGP